MTQERKSYQLYRLEGELEKVQFTYDCAYRSYENAKKRMADFRFSLRLGVVYCILVLLMLLILPNLLVDQIGIVAFYYIAAFFLFAGIAAFFLALGAFYKGKFGLKYFKIKKQMEQCEEHLLEESTRLNKIQMQKEMLEEEVASKKEKVSEEIGMREENNIRMQQEDIVCRLDMLALQKQRAEREKQELQKELVVLTEEENHKRAKRERHQTCMFVGLVAILISILFYYFGGEKIATAANVAGVLFFFIMVLPAAMLVYVDFVMLSVQSDFFLNRILFRNIYEYALPQRRAKLEKEIEDNRNRIEKIEKKQQYLEAEKRRVYDFNR